MVYRYTADAPARTEAGSRPRSASAARSAPAMPPPWPHAAPPPVSVVEATARYRRGSGLDPRARVIRAAAVAIGVDGAIASITGGRHATCAWLRLDVEPGVSSLLADALLELWADSARRVVHTDFTVRVDRAGFERVAPLPPRPRAGPDWPELSMRMWAELCDAVLFGRGSMSRAPRAVVSALVLYGLAVTPVRFVPLGGVADLRGAVVSDLGRRLVVEAVGAIDRGPR